MTSRARNDDPATQLAEVQAELMEAKQQLALAKRAAAYGLTWEQQSEDAFEQLKETIPILDLDPSRAVGEATARPHILIEGENLHAMSSLMFSHRRAIDLIYIDPPYNLGNKDFIYNDHYVNADDQYRHSKWLSFMDRRIRLAKALLAPTGFLAVSIDDTECAQLRMLLNQHFGESRVSVVAVKMAEASGVRLAGINKSGGIAKYKEYVLFAKASDQSEIRLPEAAKPAWGKEYKTVLEGVSVEDMDFLRDLEVLAEAEATLVPSETLDRANEILARATPRPATEAIAEALDSSGAKGDQLSRRSWEKRVEMEDAWRRENAWRIVRGAPAKDLAALARTARPDATKKDLFIQVSKKGLIRFMIGFDQLCVARDHLEFHPGDFWADIKTTGIASEGGVKFKNGKKPLALMHRIIGAHPRPDALVLDFFAGSGTTGNAVAEVNHLDGGTRQCILITNNENDICSETTFPRMRGVLTGDLANGKTVPPLPGSLRALKSFSVSAEGSRDGRLRRVADRATGLIALREGVYDQQEISPGRLSEITGPHRRVLIWNGLSTEGIEAYIDPTPVDEREHVLYAFAVDDAADPGLMDIYPAPDWRVEAMPHDIVAAWERALREARG